MVDDSFLAKIERFNEIYKLDGNDKPTLLGVERLENFKDILSEEVDEIDDIIKQYKEYIEKEGDNLSEDSKLEIFTTISDWLGDIVVYVTSEARRWGVPIDDALDIIMDSNFSKLDKDGNPIYDERGKVMKGPDYWKPEPNIKELLKKKLEEG